MNRKVDGSAYTPEGWRTVTPRIFTDDIEGLVDFLKRVFGAKRQYRSDRPAEMQIGDSIVMVSGAEARGPAVGFLYVYVPNADAVYKKAVESGATSLEAPLDTPYGDRRAMIEDAWGNTWQIATRR